MGNEWVMGGVEEEEEEDGRKKGRKGRVVTDGWESGGEMGVG